MLNCIKIEVEGHEYNVRKGAVKLLKRDRPHVIIELEHRHTDTVNKSIKLLINLGYEGYAISQKELIPLKFIDLSKNKDNFVKFSRCFNKDQEYINNFLFVAS